MGDYPKKNKLLITFVVLVLIVGAIFVVNKVTTGVSMRTPGTAFQITNMLGSQNAYLASSNLAIFDEEKINERFEVYKHDIQSETSTSISSASADSGFQGDTDLQSSSEYAVWYDVRNVSAGNTTWDVYASNISTGTERRVTTSPIDVSSLSVSGHYCAYINNTQDYGIYICDLSSANSPTRIFAFDSPSRSFVRISQYNNIYYVVFEDTNNSKRDIKMYNISTQATTTIANSSNIEQTPVLCGDSVFYVQANISETASKPEGYVEDDNIPVPPSGSINRYNIASSTTTSVYTIDSGKIVHLLPSFSNAHIGFLQYKDTTCSIKVIKTQDNTISTVASDTQGFSVYAVSGCISDNNLVFTVYPNDDSNSDSKVCVYDIANSTTTDIRTTTHRVFGARIYEDSIIWKETYINNDVGYDELYGYILP